VKLLPVKKEILKDMTSQEIREKFVKYFRSRGHKEIPSASLVPENDPTVLFTTAGMHPLVPYLMGENHPEGRRLCNIQKCLRTDDIEEVGDNTHNTFFEMLGYWSLGDYWKKESIKMSWEFFTKIMGLDSRKISVTVFEGNEDIPKDSESAEIWEKEIGIPKDKIYFLPMQENFWGPIGEIGPCGPCSEMFYETDLPKCGENCNPACDCGRYVEIGNNVFMEYEKKESRITNHESQVKNNEKYEYVVLKQKNVDVGLGFERLVMIKQNKNNIFETDLFQPIVDKIKNLEIENGDLSKEQKNKSEKIIADHLRAVSFIMGDDKGVGPSNVDQGYVVRKLIRRAIRHGKILGIEKVFLFKIAETVIENYKSVYPELERNKDFIIEQLVKEEEKFRETLERGLKELKKIYGTAIGGVDPENLPKGMVIQNNVMRADGKRIFHIYETYGLPVEMSQEIMKEWGIAFDEQTIKEAKEELKKHQELSRAGAAGKFKGGLADAGEETIKLHTAAHLLLESLRRILGDHIYQKGSNITAERLRFDFSHPKKLTDEEKRKVEDLVNEQIQKNLPVNCEEISLEEAKKINAMGVFENKYGEKVKVYTIGEGDNIFSREICGGPHVKNTSELSKFKIKKEQSSSAGVRRIKGVLE